jgi:hypothetical protein
LAKLRSKKGFQFRFHFYFNHSVFEIAGICLIFILAIFGCICYCKEKWQNRRNRGTFVVSFLFFFNLFYFKKENTTRNENCQCAPRCDCHSNISTLAPPPYNRVIPSQNMYQSGHDNIELSYIPNEDELPSYITATEKIAVKLNKF